MKFFTTDTKTAFEAISFAQFIAFAPIVFQASKSLRDLGILQKIQTTGTSGASLEEIHTELKLTEYGVRVLLEAGLGIGLVIKNDEKYALTKTGVFILNDKMTNVNMDFTHDICYEGMFSLTDSIKESKPTGLKKLGEWPTVYEGLAHLNKVQQDSWFNFDHYYSDGSFDQALKQLFKREPKHILDIGGNTGKFTLKCMNYNPDVKVTMLDLPGQLAMAKENIGKTTFADRVNFFPINILDDSNRFPKGADAIWMSQFLDCFSEDEIVSILKRCHEALADDGHIYIMETFWDRQKFEPGAFSLQMTSLYFTNIANGNSQMYDSVVFNKLIDKAGFVVAEQIDNIGISHTVQVCKKK
jgi:ubiquinone/menaquinone biosynthesis C-methylase UbiE